MSNAMLHPTAENLEAYVEGALEGADRAVIDSHLISCAQCQADVEEWRALFMALEQLPQLAPTSGFAERVMAHIHVPRPWYVRAGAAVARILPRTTGGWALVAALLGVPVAVGGGFLTWLLSKSYITSHGLWVFVTDQAGSYLANLVRGVMTALMQTDVAAWLAKSVDSLFETAGFRGVGALAGLAALLTMLSIWVLYKNLFRTPPREATYVTYSV